MKLLMFDLENTVIQHWTDRSLCWVDSNTDLLDEMMSATNSTGPHDRSGRNQEKPYAFYDWCDANQDRLDKYDEVWLVDDSVDDAELDDFKFKVVLRNPVVMQSFI